MFLLPEYVFFSALFQPEVAGAEGVQSSFARLVYGVLQLEEVEEVV
ncbi:MAG: hypothetical protein NVSMB70_13770 [Chamaesiphon sp.]